MNHVRERIISSSHEVGYFGRYPLREGWYRTNMLKGMAGQGVDRLARLTRLKFGLGGSLHLNERGISAVYGQRKSRDT